MNLFQPPPPPPPMPDYNGLLGNDDIGGFKYGIGVSIGVLLLITTITLTSYYCTRNHLSSSSPSSQTNQDSTRVHHHHHHVIIDVVHGLDEDTIQSYPKMLYSEAKGKYSTTSSCCHICLGDYKGNHVLRQLPDCNHFFHVKCIDTWLKLNPTCPVCRTSPLPTPLSTPLAVVVPLSSSVATTRMS
ncbi:unnamed protein product [Cochlearia groenlandica]